jgi:CheY-like chemotaxis protein
VLVVEDEASIALDLARLLQSYGAKVISANGPDTALRFIARVRLDCAVLDVRLGDDDCDPVARALASNVVPFVFVTAYSQSEVVRRYPRSPVIAKPYTPVDVIHNVNALLAVSLDKRPRLLGPLPC